MKALSSVYRRTRSRLALSLLFFAVSWNAHAQIVQGLQPHKILAAYGTLPTDVTPNFSYYGPVLFGYSLGGYLQTPYLVGAEVRGSIQRRMDAQHEESALIGPRASMRFGRFVPYTNFLIGAGNGWRFREPPVLGQKKVKPIEDVGMQWTWSGGLDIKLNHRWSLRAGEISYSKIYLKEWTLTPVNVTAGVVFRIN